ncbi:MAG TPA: PfkB family carbohydrate kinase [Planctomycetota bacterium]|nr:PfkB family carbohydrate kinase [Planctomycetota bacterium]
MTVLVVGSTAYDTIETPEGSRADCLGGSSTYFSLAARFFAPVRLVSVVGKDFRDADVSLLQGRGVDTEGLEIADGATFRWSGRYHADMNQRDTIAVELNTFGSFDPKVPEAWKSTPFVFLANGHPLVQTSVLDQVSAPKFVVADTMNLWIETARNDLDMLLRRIDGLILNDEEVKMLTGEKNLIRAGQTLLSKGPKLVIVKKGEHGSFLFSEFFQFALPAYPTEVVRDPTGAGDSFAGGFMGYLAGVDRVTLWNLKRAMAYGTVMASLNVEAFGVDRLAAADRSEVDQRFHELLQFVSF